MRKPYHSFGDIYSIYFLKIGAQSSGKSSNPTTKIEGSAITPFFKSTKLHERVNFTLAGGKEFLDVPPPKLFLVVRQNCPEWIQFSEVFPLPLCRGALDGWD